MIHGVLLLDKPLGWSSNHAVQQIKRLYQASKVGHTGTLDPLATGMLPLCLGEATKFGQCLLESDKTYDAVVQLGQTTLTGDREGEVLVQRPVPTLSGELLSAIEQRFTGVIQQIPPMFSALKHQGQALYTLARRGEIIERVPRSITIHHLNLTILNASQLHLSVRCSKGTYIRTLAEDIGAALDCGAHLHTLHRSSVGALPLDAMVDFDTLTTLAPEQLHARLLPIDCCVAELPSLSLSALEAQRLFWGQDLVLAAPIVAARVRLYDAEQRFLGVAHYAADGQILTQRLINPGTLAL